MYLNHGKQPRQAKAEVLCDGCQPRDLEWFMGILRCREAVLQVFRLTEARQGTLRSRALTRPS